MISELYKRTLYLNKDIDYLFNCEIREYDLKSAGFNLLKYFKLVPEKNLIRLEKMSKDNRQKEIGMMQRKDKGLINSLKDAFTEARKLFFKANNIEDSDILAIKKDAIFVIDKICYNTIFDNLEFRCKNTYLGYMYINKLEIYYKNNKSPIELKGISDDVLEYHKDYMLDFIKEIFDKTIYTDRKYVIEFLTDFIKLYRNNELEFGYYRQLDNDSYFNVKYDDDDTYTLIHDLDDDEGMFINITYNYFNIIIPIANIFI